MKHDTRPQFDSGLLDDEDRDRHDGVPHQHDRTDEVVDGEVVATQDGFGQPEHRHDQDGVAHTDDPRTRDGEPVEPVDLDGFGGTTEGGHDVADPNAVDETAATDADATDDPAHPEFRTGDDAPTDAEHTATADDEYADGRPADGEPRTLDDLADVAVPEDDALADGTDRPVDALDQQDVDADTDGVRSDDPAAEAEQAALAADAADVHDVNAQADTLSEDRDVTDVAAPDAEDVVGGPDAVDPEPEAQPEDAATGAAGDVAAVVAAASLWPAATAEGLRERWQAAQLRFVDDPPAVAAELRDLVGEAVRTLQESLTTHQRELDEAFGEAGTDTERLRLAVQRYRDFHQQLLER